MSLRRPRTRPSARRRFRARRRRFPPGRTAPAAPRGRPRPSCSRRTGRCGTTRSPCRRRSRRVSRRPAAAARAASAPARAPRRPAGHRASSPVERRSAPGRAHRCRRRGVASWVRRPSHRMADVQSPWRRRSPGVAVAQRFEPAAAPTTNAVSMLRRGPLPGIRRRDRTISGNACPRRGKRRNCSGSRRWTRRGTLTNDENEAVPGGQVTNPPLRQVGPGYSQRTLNSYQAPPAYPRWNDSGRESVLSSESARPGSMGLWESSGRIGACAAWTRRFGAVPRPPRCICT